MPYKLNPFTGELDHSAISAADAETLTDGSDADALHKHSGTSNNDFAIGDGADSNKAITAQNADANKPKLRYNATTNKWEYSNNGITYSNFSTAVVSDTEVAKYRIAEGETISVGDYEQIFLAELYIIEGTLAIATEGILAVH